MTAAVALSLSPQSESPEFLPQAPRHLQSACPALPEAMAARAVHASPSSAGRVLGVFHVTLAELNCQLRVTVDPP